MALTKQVLKSRNLNVPDPMKGSSSFTWTFCIMSYHSKKIIQRSFKEEALKTEKFSVLLTGRVVTKYFRK